MGGGSRRRAAGSRSSNAKIRRMERGVRGASGKTWIAGGMDVDGVRRASLMGPACSGCTTSAWADAARRINRLQLGPMPDAGAVPNWMRAVAADRLRKPTRPLRPLAPTSRLWLRRRPATVLTNGRVRWIAGRLTVPTSLTILGFGLKSACASSRATTRASNFFPEDSKARQQGRREDDRQCEDSLMPLSRRTALAGLAGVAGLSAVRPAAAQTGYPNRPIRLIVPYAAGGQADV